MEIADRFLRDLCWAVNSPSLLEISASVDTNSYTSNAGLPLSPDDVDREHLARYLSDHLTKRTGRYFERLILYWLQYVRGCQIVAHSLQLRDGKRTVGEIDLLFRDEQQRLTHWETAVKFYLQVDVGSPPETDYIGPNANDTLQRKTEKLVDHQLPLSCRYFPDVERRQAFVKGRIFYHWQSEAKKTSPTLLAADHLRGRWMRASEAAAYLKADRGYCRPLSKPFWLADEVRGGQDGVMLTVEEAMCLIEDHFANQSNAMLISVFRERDPQQHESERIFIVSNQWPSTTSRLGS